MQKMQILFPAPLMKQMRELAAREDISISDIVRKATENWLERYPAKKPSQQKVPVVDTGRCLVDSKAMKEALYE